MYSDPQMGMSLAQQVAMLPAQLRDAWLEAQPEEIIQEILVGEWWWTARPEQVPPPGDWFICLALAGRGFGKAVSLDTMIPGTYAELMLTHDADVGTTQTGLKKMGDIRVGDQVFDELGQPCRVIAMFDRVPEVAYRLTFSDGVIIDVCDEHQWVTWDHSARKSYLRSNYVDMPTNFPKDWAGWRPFRRGRGTVAKLSEDGPGPRIRTTQQIVDTLTYNKRGDINHCIPVAGDLLTRHIDLELDPWLLGYWLGNGATGVGGISGNVRDLDHVTDRLLRAGFRMQPVVRKGGFTGTPYGLVNWLRQIGVLNNKHVPERYLWASSQQRRELLAGLLDSDGYIDPTNSQVEFSSITRVLAEAVVHLARSLGQKPVLTEGVATLYGVPKGAKYRVTWRPTFCPVLSPRKASAYQEPKAQALRNHHRMIVKAEHIDPVPMRCITVDSPNSMYLATEAFIPTHNSRSSSEWIVERLLQHPLDRHGVPTEHLVVADTLADARTINAEGPSGILNVLHRRKVEHRYKQSPRPMVLFPEGAKIYLEGADDPDTGRGYNAASIVCDEIAKWVKPYETWYEGLLPSLRADLATDHPRAFVTTTPKPIKLLIEWLARNDHTIHVISGSTFDNAANLSEHALRELKLRYDGTALGEQELYGKLLELMGGGLFRRLDIVKNRVKEVPDDIVSTVIGCDPNLTGEDATFGIVVMARTADNHLYVLADCSVPDAGRAAALAIWRAAHRYKADLVVYEENLGKRYLQEVLRDSYMECIELEMFPRNSTPPMKPVHAKHGKKTRAEPVALRSEQGKLHMVGEFEELENQMILFDPESTRESPDRMDALVHAALHLMAGERRRMAMSDPSKYDFQLTQDLYDLGRLL